MIVWTRKNTKTSDSLYWCSTIWNPFVKPILFVVFLCHSSLHLYSYRILSQCNMYEYSKIYKSLQHADSSFVIIVDSEVSVKNTILRPSRHPSSHIPDGILCMFTAFFRMFTDNRFQVVATSPSVTPLNSTRACPRCRRARSPSSPLSGRKRTVDRAESIIRFILTAPPYPGQTVSFRLATVRRQSALKRKVFWLLLGLACELTPEDNKRSIKASEILV